MPASGREPATGINAAGPVVVVSDAGPLIALGRLDLLSVLGALFSEMLVRARRRGLVGPLAPMVAALRASGQRLSHAAVAHALAAVGEAA